MNITRSSTRVELAAIFYPTFFFSFLGTVHLQCKTNERTDDEDYHKDNNDASETLLNLVDSEESNRIAGGSIVGLFSKCL